MKTILKFLNENHWYIIAAIAISGIAFMVYGCESTVTSLVDPIRKVNRLELQNELNYFVGMAKARDAELDRKDETKQALLDAFNIIGKEGTINPSGLLNLAGTIGAISFGLNRNQKLKNVSKKTNGTTA
jgi:uncharacterized membrane protein